MMWIVIAYIAALLFPPAIIAGLFAWRNRVESIDDAERAAVLLW